MKNLKNEEGSVLVVMIAVTFVVAYLLLMLASQIETKTASYERTRTYLTMNLLEEAGLRQLENFVAELDEITDFTATWFLRDRGQMTIIGEKVGNTFAISYEIRYNDNIRTRQLRFCLELGYIHWHVD